MGPGDGVVLWFAIGAREHALVTFDPNVRPALMLAHDEQLVRTERFVQASDVVKLSDEDPAWLYPGASLDVVERRILGIGPRSRRSPEATRDPRLVHGLAALVGERGLEAVRDGGAYTADVKDALGGFASRCAAVTVGRAGADLPGPAS